mmetsp:Transcript_11102/g.8191  ORF Transcript_11102/g.8191 Transcript_11102/m.8191 type:complete len:89 (-) Transcript_11102:64-330(-)
MYRNTFGLDPLPEELIKSCDLIVAKGTTMPNHLPLTIFEFLLNVLKKGGYYAFNARDTTWNDPNCPFGATMQKLVDEGKYREVRKVAY